MVNTYSLLKPAKQLQNLNNSGDALKDLEEALSDVQTTEWELWNDALLVMWFGLFERLNLEHWIAPL